MRFVVAVDNRVVARLFASLEEAGFRVEVLEGDAPMADPTAPTVVFTPVPVAEPAAGDAGPLVAGSLLIDPEARTVHRGAEPVRLGRREFDVLVVLAARGDRVVGREELRRAVWRDEPVCDNTVEVHVSALRRKLRDADHVLIETVRGVGYVLRSRRDADARLESLVRRRHAALAQREVEVARREAIALARRIESGQGPGNGNDQGSPRST